MKTKQDLDLVNCLITTADSSTSKSTSPHSSDGRITVATILFDAFLHNPYSFTQSQVFYEVHIKRLGKDPHKLKLEKYKLQRSELCSKLGWGIHGDLDGKLALIPCESSEYKQLLTDPKVTKKNAYNK